MITHPEKVLFPEDGITKGDLAAYYRLVAPAMRPHIRRRPATLERYPSGIAGKGFFQKDVVKGFPSWLARVEVPKKKGIVHHALVNTARSLEWVANQNSITLSTMAARIETVGDLWSGMSRRRQSLRAATVKLAALRS